MELNQSNLAIERLQEQKKEWSEKEAASLKSQLASMNLNEVMHNVYDNFKKIMTIMTNA